MEKNTRSTYSYQHIILPTVLLSMLVFIAYSSALQAGYIWDDPAHVVENPHLRTASGLWKTWFDPFSSPLQYYPLTYTTFWIEFQFWELNPFGYHFNNILLHTANAILLWAILVRLGFSAAWFIAIIFALHPLHVESVAWISERKNTFSAFLYFSSFLAYLKFQEKNESLYYRGSLLLYVLALFAKTTACSLPVAIMIATWWQQGKWEQKNWRNILPFFCLGIPISLVTPWFEKIQVGAAGIEWQLSFVERIFIASRAVVFYIQKLLVPHDLTFVYPRWSVDYSIVWWFSLFACVLMLATFFFRHRFWGKSLFAAFLFFAATVFPALGFFDIYPMRYTFVANHYIYLASIGVIAIAVESFYRLFVVKSKALTYCTLTSVIIAFTFLTWSTSLAYQDAETLWYDTIEKNPACPMAYNNLGFIEYERGLATKNPGSKQEHFQLAAVFYQKALEVDPNWEEATYNLAVLHAYLRNYNIALQLFQRAAQINPSYPDNYIYLGKIYHEHKKDFRQALGMYKKALEIHPNSEQALIGTGLVFMDIKDFSRASFCFLRVLQQNSSLLNIRYHLAQCYLELNQLPKAEKEISTLEKIAPTYTKRFLLLTRKYIIQQNYLEAEKYLKKSIHHGLKVNPAWEKTIENYTMEIQNRKTREDGENK